MRHIEIRYGKYLNEMTTLIASEHVMTRQCGPVSRRLEPGQPNMPATQSYQIAIANLSPTGEQMYPLAFWQQQSRTKAEGAFQELQIYFEVRFAGQREFVGICRKIMYDQWQAVCRIQLSDIMEVVRLENRKMLKSFEFTEVGITALDESGEGFNDLPPLRDLENRAMTHEAITVVLSQGLYSGGLVPQPFLDTVFTRHLGWNQVPFVFGDNSETILLREDVRATWVKIGDFTILTRVRLRLIQRQILVSGGTIASRRRQELQCTIWHNKSGVVAGILPTGRFLTANRELITSSTESIDITFFEANLGFDSDIALLASSLPLDRNFIFGAPFVYDDSVIRITSDRYAYFDVVEATRRIVNTDFSLRHTTLDLVGSLTITQGSSPEGGGSEALASLTPIQAPIATETVYIAIEKSGSGLSSQSEEFQIEPTDSLNAIRVKAVDAIIGDGTSSLYWFAANNDPDVDIESRDPGELWNGFLISVRDAFTHQPSLTQWTFSHPSSGGTDGGFSAGPLEVLIGNEVFVQTDPLTADMIIDEVVMLLLEALNGVSQDTYTFDLTSENVSRILFFSKKGVVETIGLDTGETGVGWESSPIQGALDLFDLTYLRDVNRLAFLSDVIMFGWAEKRLVECLVGAAWQVSAYLYTTKDGRMAISSRDWYAHHLLSQADLSFNAITIPDNEWEPLAGENYEEGFRSYEMTHVQEIVEINNLLSRESTTIWADREGSIDEPTLLNQPIRSSNYRTHDLGAPGLSNPHNLHQIRFSPDDPRWPNPEKLDKFLPVPSTQLQRMASTHFFPNPSTRIQVYYPSFPSLDVGRYIVDSASRLWLVTSCSPDPSQLTITMDIEFRSSLAGLVIIEDDGVSVGDIFELQNVTIET